MPVSRADAEAQLQAHLWEATPWGHVRNILSEPPPHGEVRQPPPDLGLVHVMIIRCIRAPGSPAKGKFPDTKNAT